jgi:hypothetical protein
MKVVIRFAAQQHAPGARLFHLLQAAGTIAARQQQQRAEDPRRPRGDCRVVMVQTKAEVRVAKRRIALDGLLQGIVDALPIARGGEILPSLSAQEHTGPVRAPQIEPCFAALRLPLHPCLGRGDGSVDPLHERGITSGVFRVEQETPVIRDRTDDVAGR